MSVGDQIMNMHPEVKFTGGSDIHRSQVKYLQANMAPERDAVLKAMIHADLGGQIFDYITSQFDEVEWLISRREFAALVVSDFNRHFLGLGDTQHQSKLKNPVTSNVFNRIGLRGSFLYGVRFWLTLGMETTGLNFRVRIAKLTESEGKTRTKSREAAVDAVEELQEIMHDLEIGPPTVEEYETAKQHVPVLE